MTFIPVSQPVIAKNAKKYILDCLTSGWVSSAGPYVEKFERTFGAFIGTKYAVATSSGTSALHLSLASLGIGPGDEVIMPALTMIATALPVIYLGAKPVLVDVDERTGNIDPSLIEAKITKRTKAIMPVHLHGHPADMAPISRLAKKYHLAIVEDAAEAHGAQYQLKMQSEKLKIREQAKTKAKASWRMVGGIGDLGCFSFYGNKIITTGEGGMVTTNSKQMADRVRSLRNLARTPGKHFLHQEVAFAYRMSSLQAALGCAQVEEADRYIAKKRTIAKYYQSTFSTIPVMGEEGYAKSVYWHVVVQLSNQRTRDRVAKQLAKLDIETRDVVIPLHKQPALLKLGLFAQERYPVSDMLAEQGLCIPSGIALTKADQDRVIAAIQDSL